jgi:hypothetical protein
MITKKTLIEIADAFRLAAGIERESTLSYRIFQDNKRLTKLRGDGDITTGSFNNAMIYMASHWPDGHSLPNHLAPYLPKQSAEDAA